MLACSGTMLMLEFDWFRSKINRVPTKPKHVRTLNLTVIHVVIRCLVVLSMLVMVMFLWQKYVMTGRKTKSLAISDQMSFFVVKFPASGRFVVKFPCK